MMGEQADYMFDRMIDRQINIEKYWKRPSRSQKSLERLFASVGNDDWTQKNGAKIKVRDMELPHLRNVVALLKRREHPRAGAFQLYLSDKESSDG